MWSISLLGLLVVETPELVDRQLFLDTEYSLDSSLLSCSSLMFDHRFFLLNWPVYLIFDFAWYLGHRLLVLLVFYHHKTHFQCSAFFLELLSKLSHLFETSFLGCVDSLLLRTQGSTSLTCCLLGYLSSLIQAVWCSGHADLHQVRTCTQTFRFHACLSQSPQTAHHSDSWSPAASSPWFFHRLQTSPWAHASA